MGEPITPEQTEEISEKQLTEKERLEVEKLNLEIADLNKAWWKKPTYIAALFPTVLALMTLIYGLANGYFQSSFSKLENQKLLLQMENERLEKKKNELIKSVEEVETLLTDVKNINIDAENAKNETAVEFITPKPRSNPNTGVPRGRIRTNAAIIKRRIQDIKSKPNIDEQDTESK